MIDYEKEIAKYGASLSDREKDVARRAFNDLLGIGFTFEWLYYAIQRLEGRSLLTHPYLLFYKPFQQEVSTMMEEAREEERKKKARDAEICAKIEKQILQFEEKKKNIKVIFQPPKKKVVPIVDLSIIADMEDDVDGAMPQK